MELLALTLFVLVLFQAGYIIKLKKRQPQLPDLFGDEHGNLFMRTEDGFKQLTYSNTQEQHND